MSDDQDPLIPKLNYNDRFVNIDGQTKTLTLKNYCFLRATLKLYIPSLLYIRRASDAVRRIGIELQGLSIDGIIWALDWRRGTWITGPASGFEKSFVVKAQGARLGLRSGFSVENPEMFLAVLEQVHPGVAKTALRAPDEQAEVDPRLELAAIRHRRPRSDEEHGSDHGSVQ